ncbi:MAG: hypothetical protein M1834_009351 [Cirrosporium novae-zelandiae]|nr:MAG: hypothetical protein M1834_009351 [Cirrosporium novae-zelandiae]
MPQTETPLTLACLPPHIQASLLTYLTIPTLLILKQTSHHFNTLVHQHYTHAELSSLPRTAFWHFLRFAESWSTPIYISPENKPQQSLTCYGCLRHRASEYFLAPQRVKRPGGELSYGRTCIGCEQKYPEWLSGGFFRKRQRDKQIFAIRCAVCREWKYGQEANDARGRKSKKKRDIWVCGGCVVSGRGAEGN